MAVNQPGAPGPERRRRQWAWQAGLLAALLAFGLLAVFAGRYHYFPVDLSLTRMLQSYQAAWFRTLMVWVSLPGYLPQAAILTAAILVLLFALRMRREALVALLAAAGSAILGELVKAIVQRPRPSASLVIVLQPFNGYGFPSGHVFTYTAFYGFLFFLSVTLLKPSLARTLLLFVLGSLVALVGLSRVYVGDHWPSDVLGGYLLGGLWLAACIEIYRRSKLRIHPKIMK